MPSNKELIAEAEALADELSREVSTEGLNNNKLAELVSDLKAKKKDAETETQADEAEAEVVNQEPAYYVAPRNSITSKKGILSGDTQDEVKPEYLHGGQDALDSLVKSGHILKG